MTKYDPIYNTNVKLSVHFCSGRVLLCVVLFSPYIKSN